MEASSSRSSRPTTNRRASTARARWRPRPPYSAVRPRLRRRGRGGGPGSQYVATAAGWGGLPRGALPRVRPGHVRRRVPADGARRPRRQGTGRSRYNAEGYFGPTRPSGIQAQHHGDAERRQAPSPSIFGGCDDDRPNCLRSPTLELHGAPLPPQGPRGSGRLLVVSPRSSLDPVALEQLATDHHALDVGGSLADQQQRRVSVEPLDLVLLGVAVAAVDAEGSSTTSLLAAQASSLAMPASRSQRCPRPSGAPPCG